MKTCSLILIIYCICKYSSVEIKQEFKKKYFNFCYGIIFKYEGMLAHSFDRFFVVTKFILPTINALKFLTINFNETCSYLQEKNGHSVKAKQYISDLIVYCKKITPLIQYYTKTNFFY